MKVVYQQITSQLLSIIPKTKTGMSHLKIIYPNLKMYLYGDV